MRFSQGEGQPFPRAMVAAGLTLAFVLGISLEAGAHHDEMVDKLERGTTQLVSVASSGEQGDNNSGVGTCSGPITGPAHDFAASDDGRYVVFTSLAGNLHPADLNGQSIADIFVFDRRKEKLELVSAMPNGLAFTLPADAEVDACRRPRGVLSSHTPAISGNGRYVAFASDLPLTGGEGELAEVLPGVDQVFIRDLRKGSTELVSTTWDGRPPLALAEHGSGWAGLSISDSGRFVAFTSRVSNIMEDACSSAPIVDLPVTVPVEAGDCRQTYVRDVRNDETILVSRSSTGEPGSFASENPGISGNGRYVVFDSGADNLVPDDLNYCPASIQAGPSCQDVFLHDLRTRETELVSIARDGGSGNERSDVYNWSPGHQPISDDGRFIGFQSRATDLVPAGEAGMFVRDRRKGRTERVSVSTTGTALPGSFGPSVSDDGRFVGVGLSMSTRVNSFVPTGGSLDEHNDGGHFVHDRKTGQADRVAQSPHGGGLQRDYPDAVLTTPVIGGNARFLLGYRFQDEVGARGDTNGFADVFVRDIGNYGRGIGPLGPAKSSAGVASDGRDIRRFAALTLADPAGDAVVSDLGADIVRAAVVHRPELGDIFVRIDVERMFGSAPFSGLTPYPVIYGLRFTTGQANYELRAEGHGGHPSAGGGAFGLFQCDEHDCAEVAKLAGGFGTVGEAVVASVPLRHLRLGAGVEIGALEAFSGLGSYDLGVSRLLDSARR